MVAMTHAQATAWTVVDSICVAVVLSSMDRLRRRSGLDPAWPRWVLLVISLLAFPRVLWAPTRAEIFDAEVVVVSAHLGTLLLAAFDLPLVFRLLRDLEARVASRR